MSKKINQSDTSGKHLGGSRTKGFTAVEMMIVLGIILLLAALLFPVLSRAREAARRTSCLANMKQLGSAFMLYTQDANQKYPRSGVYTAFAGQTAWAPGNGHWVAGTAGEPISCLGLDQPPGKDCKEAGQYVAGWQAKPDEGAIFPYVKNMQVFICPSNATGRPKKLTYSMNCAVSGINEVRIRQPAEIVLIVDEEKTNDGYFFAVHDQKAESKVGSDYTNSTDTLTTVHNGGGNLLFCDGHAKFFPTKNFQVDGTEEGKLNKWRDTGTPRFHDSAFSPVSPPAGQLSTGSNWFLGEPTDACNAKQRLP